MEQTGNGKRKHEEAKKDKGKQRLRETEETGANKRGKPKHTNHPVGGGKPAERRNSGAEEPMAESADEVSEEEEVEDRKKKRRKLQTRREKHQEKMNKLKRDRQEKRRKEKETKKRDRDQMEAVMARWMATRDEQANKEEGPKGAGGEKGEEITGKRKREEEEKPD